MSVRNDQEKLNRVFGVPGLVWMLLFFAGPLFYLLALSFAQKGTYGGVEWVFNFENYRRSFDPLFLEIFFRSLFLAGSTTVFCLMIALPLTWALVTLPVRQRSFFLCLLVVPFLMNLITRVYALKTVVSFDGYLAEVLRFLLGPEFDALVLSQNQPLVFYGMIATYLPFMIFPIFVALEKFDFLQVEAAEDLGASSLQILFQILIPQLRPAIASGITMVFVPALGEFVIPDLLGGAKVMLAGNLITDQFLKSRDWPFGAALAVELILIMSVLTYLIFRWGGKSGASHAQ